LTESLLYSRLWDLTDSSSSSIRLTNMRNLGVGNLRRSKMITISTNTWWILGITIIITDKTYHCPTCLMNMRLIILEGNSVNPNMLIIWILTPNLFALNLTPKHKLRRSRKNSKRNKKLYLETSFQSNSSKIRQNLSINITSNRKDLSISAWCSLKIKFYKCLALA
jgi:hypothetical protein